MSYLGKMTTNRFEDARNGAGGNASEWAEQARHYGEKAQHVARQFKPFVQRSFKERPMATVAGALAVGFLLGALWRR